ncbi:Iron oxidase [Balamuthia mandrillaris]
MLRPATTASVFRNPRASCLGVLSQKATSPEFMLGHRFYVTQQRPPVVDLSPLQGLAEESRRNEVAREMYDACSTWGAFYVTGHGVSTDLQAQLVHAAQRFFALPLEERMALHVKNGGLAWRGYMPMGGEGTHGQVDVKDGLYLGPEHGLDHHRVKAKTPLYGPNQIPDVQLPELRPTVQAYLDEMKRVGDLIMQAVSLSLGLNVDYMHQHFTSDPILLFRMFCYPSVAKQMEEAKKQEGDDTTPWGIGEHSDYGLLTILKQQSAGLQFHSDEHGWVDVPPIDNTFVCNVGDLLDRITDGRFKSPKHRVRNIANHDRLAFPLFYDPSWDAEMKPLPLDHLPAVDENNKSRAETRWERSAYRSLSGPYCNYLAKKVSKIFLALPPSVANFEPARGPSTRFNISIHGS